MTFLKKENSQNTISAKKFVKRTGCLQPSNSMVKSSITKRLFQNTYNCDSNEPTPLVDTGWIRDPIKKFEFEIKIFETHCGIVV